MKAALFMTATFLIGGGSSVLQAARSHEPDVADAAPDPAVAASQAPMAASDTPAETVIVVDDQPIPNLPGNRLVSLVVDYPPGARSGPHRHAPSAFIFAYVVFGEILSQVDAAPARLYGPGESWTENPGAHHVVSANASDTKPARLLAVFVLDASDERMTIPDPQ